MGLSGECSHRSETSCQPPASASIDTYALIYVHIEPLYIPITCTCVRAHSRNANHTLLQGNGCYRGKFPSVAALAGDVLHLSR